MLGTIAELVWLISAFLLLARHWNTDEELWRYVVDHRWWITIAWVFAVFGWPFLVGWSLAEAEAYYLRHHEAGTTPERWRKPIVVAGRMVAAQGPINDDSSWDVKFTRLEQVRGEWILVELVDGNWVAGYFGNGSDASVDPKERDLYIADVLYTSFERRFRNVGEPDGILIPAGQIRIIHFWEEGSTWESDEEFEDDESW